MSDTRRRPEQPSGQEQLPMQMLQAGPMVSSEDRGAMVASAVTKAQGQILLAKQFPRDEDDCFQRLIKACKRPSFAANAIYSFPRGGKSVEGPSVKLAREAARVWGNIEYGFEVVRDDQESMTIQGSAWDIQTGARVFAEDSFRKRIQRKQKDGSTIWLKPDERDMRELMNRRAAILIRNCILQLLPSDLIDDAQAQVRETESAGVQVDPAKAKKDVIKAFGDLGIRAADLVDYVGKPIEQFLPDDIVDLRKVFASVRDGQATWASYLDQAREGRGETPRVAQTVRTLKDVAKGAADAYGASSAPEKAATEPAGQLHSKVVAASGVLSPDEIETFRRIPIDDQPAALDRLLDTGEMPS